MVMGQRGDFGVVGESKIVPAPGRFKSRGDRCGVSAGLVTRPGPIWRLHDVGPVAVAMLAIGPPVANPPHDAALGPAKLLAQCAPVVSTQTFRQTQFGRDEAASRRAVLRQRA